MKSCFVTRIRRCAIADNLIIRRVKRISVKKISQGDFVSQHFENNYLFTPKIFTC